MLFTTKWRVGPYDPRSSQVTKPACRHQPRQRRKQERKYYGHCAFFSANGSEISRCVAFTSKKHPCQSHDQQHLPKSTSLPILQLTPKDRPIFTCCQCGFVNTFIPLCLWCCWTSDAAHKKFELSMPRMRRASAPPRFFWQQRCHSTPEWRASYITMTSAQTRNSGIKVSADVTSTKGAEIIPHGHSADQSRNLQQKAQGEGWISRRTSNLTLRVNYPPQHHDVHYETPSATATNVREKVATATSSV